MSSDGKIIHGMDERERQRQTAGIKTIYSSYERRDSDVEEVSIALTGEEVEVMGRAVTAYFRKAEIADLLGQALGVDLGSRSLKVIQTLHYRLAKAANTVSDGRTPDPDEAWAGDQVRAEKENPDVAPEVDPDPLIEREEAESGESVPDLDEQQEQTPVEVARR